MKDKKIKQILKDVDENLSSLSKEITESLFDDTPKTKKSEEKKRLGVDFQSYHKPEKIEFDPQPKEPDLVESLAKNISANLINEIARDVFGEEVETIEDVAPDVQDMFVEAITEQVMESPEAIESGEDLKLSEERVAELQEARVKSYVMSMQKMAETTVRENELLPSKKEMFEAIGDPNDPVTQAQLSSSMSTILIRIQQGLSSLGGGGAGLYEIQGLLDSLDDKRQNILDSSIGSLLGNLLGHIDSLGGEFDSFYTGLNTDVVPEGPSGDNLYYRESRVQEFVDSDYVQERMAVPNTMTFKGGTAVDVDSVADPDNGDVYVNDSDAIANATWIGVAGELIPESVALAWADSDSPGTGGKWYKVGDMKQDNDQLILDAENKAMPPGSITMWMGGSSPSGYFLCRGGTFDPLVYPLLHAHLQASYSGYVSGSLPDFRGRFPGGDGAHGLDPLDGKRGRLFNQTTADTSSGLTADIDYSGVSATSTGSVTVNSNGSHTHAATSTAGTDVSISGGSANTSSAGAHHHDTKFWTNKDNNASNKGSNVNLLTQYYNNGNETTRQTVSAGSHSHTVDLSSVSATASTEVTTTNSNAGSHAHTATTNVNTNINGLDDLEVVIDGWDPYTRPYAFNVNFIIKHDAR